MSTPEAGLATRTPSIPHLISVEVWEGVALVAVRGDVHATAAPALRDVLTWAVDHHSGVVLDLSAATTIDRIGLSVLIQAQDRAHARAIRLCFAEPSKALSSALSALRADAMFVMFELCADAFAWLRDKSPRRPSRSVIPSPRVPVQM